MGSNLIDGTNVGVVVGSNVGLADGDVGETVGEYVGGQGVVEGRALVPKVLVMVVSHPIIHVNGSPANALIPIVITLLGMVTAVREKHDSKA